MEMRMRLAVAEDTEVLSRLIDSSVRGLQKEDYSAAQIDNALKTVFGVDRQLIADGTYFVVEARVTSGGKSASEATAEDVRTRERSTPGRTGAQHAAPLPEPVEAQKGESAERFVIAGCGGWSRRKKLYGGDAWTEQRIEYLDPRVDAAKIRAFFIAPSFARRGVGTLILEACEAAAFAEGFRRF